MARAPRAVAAHPLLVTLLLVTFLVGCTVGPSQRPPVAVRGVPVAAPATIAPSAAATVPDPDGQQSALVFRDCTALTYRPLPPPPGDRLLRAECAQLTVPADPRDPTFDRIVLDVVRTGLGDGPGRAGLATRPPLLVLGDTALDPTARHAARLAEQMPAPVLARYTLIGLDRRGTGADPFACSRADARAALLDADPAGFDAAALLDSARTVVQQCNLAPGARLDGFSSAAAATDVDVLRQALGVRRLSAIGSGDAADVLADWARAVPDGVGRLVLDGPAAPGVDEPDRSEDRARAAEAAFDAFALRCGGGGNCPLGAAPRAAVTALIAGLRDHPLTGADGHRLTAGAALAALRLGLGEPTGWPGLASALAAAGRGDPAPLLAVLASLTGTAGTFDAVLATRCNDAPHRIAPAEISDLAARWRTAYPLFGGSAASGLAACAPWPTGGATQAPGPVTPVGLPPLLVVGTAADPNTPQDRSKAAADALPPASYVAWQGGGTGAYPRTPCVDGLVDGLLLDGTPPPAGVTCPP